MALANILINIALVSLLSAMELSIPASSFIDRALDHQDPHKCQNPRLGCRKSTFYFFIFSGLDITDISKYRIKYSFS